MNDQGKAWLMALVMGILLPGLLFSAAEKLSMRKTSENSTPPTGENIPVQTDSPSVNRDTIAVLQADGSVINMDMDIYITAVVLGEMPVDFDTEAMKAQAVVARTYALKRYTTGQKHDGGAVCTVSSCCQSYRSAADFLSQGGTQESVNKVSQAVESTTGQVLTYNGALIEATYFSCSGGKTEDAQAVWGTDIPYLQAVDSPGEESAAHYTDNVKFTATEFTALLGISPTGSPASWFGDITYTPGGGVNTMKICGVTYKGTTLRQKLGLRSTAFTVMAVGDRVHILTKGFGHRVGMSQYGAEAMAVRGGSYEEILAHYYPGTVLESYLEN